MMREIFFGLFFLGCPTFAFTQTLQGTVTRVSDGDTLQIVTTSIGRSSQPIKLRIQGIDAPEICQTGGKAARHALRARLLQQSVSITTLARDQFGRVIARVEHRGQDVGAWLVSHGHAWSDAYRSNPGPYAAEQLAAQKSALGLWAQRPTLQPKQWRKLNGTCHSFK